MKLLLRRDQQSGLIGKITFTLTVRADLTEEEKSNIKKYMLWDTLLYERYTLLDKGSGIFGFLSRLFFRLWNFTISVNDLTGGKKVNCKDIIEMLSIEEQIREAAHTFKNVLEAAATFGGEEVIEIP